MAHADTGAVLRKIFHTRATVLVGDPVRTSVRVATACTVAAPGAIRG